MTKADRACPGRRTDPRSLPLPPGSPRNQGKQMCCWAVTCFLLLSFWWNQALRCLGRKLFMCQYFKGILLCERERGKRESQYKNKPNVRWIFFPEIKKSVYCSHLLLPSSSTMLLRCPFEHSIFKWSKPWGSCWCLAVMKYISAFEKSLQHAGILSISLKLREIFCSVSPKCFIRIHINQVSQCHNQLVLQVLWICSIVH